MSRLPSFVAPFGLLFHREQVGGGAGAQTLLREGDIFRVQLDADVLPV